MEVVFKKGIFYITREDGKTYTLDTIQKKLFNEDGRALKTTGTIHHACKDIALDMMKYIDEFEGENLAELSQNQEFLIFYHVYASMLRIGSMGNVHIEYSNYIFNILRGIEKYVKMGLPFVEWNYRNESGVEPKLAEANRAELKKFRKAYLEAMAKEEKEKLATRHRIPYFSFSKWEEQIFAEKYPHSTSPFYLRRYYEYSDLDRRLFSREYDLEEMVKLSNKLRKNNYEKYAEVIDEHSRLFESIERTMFDVWYLGEEVNTDPYDLFKEYDKWIQTRKALQYTRIDEKMRETRRAYLEWENEDFLTIVPYEAKQVLDEANQQRHCLASYLNKIANGHSIVVFFRSKKDIEKSLVTIEIERNGRIIQEKAYRNNRVQNLQIRLALDEFYRYVKEVMKG